MALRELLHRNESKLQTNHQQQEEESLLTNVNQDEGEEIEEIEDVIL
jgi:hypothetical protein